MLFRLGTKVSVTTDQEEYEEYQPIYIPHKRNYKKITLNFKKYHPNCELIYTCYWI